ncbi:MAG TPA: hypothetical protein VMQ54_04865 [Steroidobacteraceae bacterium]|jgi:hypothetical protein|nr:hypothetical protein [Steroidobacteraceae bacterium]
MPNIDRMLTNRIVAAILTAGFMRDKPVMPADYIKHYREFLDLLTGNPKQNEAARTTEEGATDSVLEDD